MGRGPSIENRKNASDAKRAKVFTKIIREITVSARAGGADPAANPRLRLAIDKGLAANMPKDTIERALKRGSGEGGSEQMQEIRYEGYGPGGVAIMVDSLTDNPTRTVADVRHAFSKHGGNLGTSGSVAFQFTSTGEIWLKTGSDTVLEEKILEIAIGAGADDVQSGDGYTEVLTSPERFHAVKSAIEAAGLEVLEADILMRPENRVAVDREVAEQVTKLLDFLEELDDVQSVHHNVELPEGELA